MRTYATQACTVGDLRKFLSEKTDLPDNAFLWIERTWAEESRLVLEIDVHEVSTPDEGYPEEDGLCFKMERRNE